MASYNLVYSTFWAETQGWSDDERVCALFLLTCEHRRAEGLYRLPSVYAAHDMGWPVGRLEAALLGLVGRGWAMRDRDWLLLVNGLRWNPPKSKTQAIGAARAVEDVPLGSPLYRAFYGAAERYANHTDGLFGRLRQPIDTPSIPHRDCADSHPAGDSGQTDTPSISLAPSPSQAPTQAQAAADAGVREGAGACEGEPDAADLWAPVDEQLRQVPPWADALDRGASVACLALVQANRDVPWVQIAGAAASSRLDPDAGFTTDSPRQALGMQLEDHRSGRSTGAGERGLRSKPKPGKSWSGAGDLSRFPAGSGAS